MPLVAQFHLLCYFPAAVLSAMIFLLLVASRSILSCLKPAALIWAEVFHISTNLSERRLNHWQKLLIVSQSLRADLRFRQKHVKVSSSRWPKIWLSSN
nr:MAG TPA: hypothetical protein [Caudoviricetes sp.]